MKCFVFLSSLTLFFLLFGFVCLFIIMPEIKSMSLSADTMANASIPMAESAMHVESIAQRYVALLLYSVTTLF